MNRLTLRWLNAQVLIVAGTWWAFGRVAAGVVALVIGLLIVWADGQKRGTDGAA